MNLSKTDARMVLDRDGKNISDKIGNLNEQLAETVEDLRQRSINVKEKEYGAIGDGLSHKLSDFFPSLELAQMKYPLAKTLTQQVDDMAIKKALNFVKSTGGEIYLPKGVYLSTPIDLTEYSNLVIRGSNNTTFFPYKNQTRIKMIEQGEVAIKCSESGVEIPSKAGKGILIDSLYLDCDFKTTIGINLNLSTTIQNTCVRYADGDGIVFEGQSYPLELRRVVSQYNRGHGLRVKAPNTTVYNLYDCEFGYNDLYGACVEDGSTCLWQNVLIQSNKQGGLKMIQQDKVNFSQPVFLERMTFLNLYTEANGSLETSDPKYDGNYALRIEGLNQDPTTSVGKIVDLTFINSSINKSSMGDYAYVRGTDSVNVIGTPFLNNSLDQAYNRGSYRSVGTRRFDGLIDLSNGTGQIKFPVTQNPSTDPTTLDDYKEGTFNLEIGQNGGASFRPTGINVASYIKIGRIVTCFVDFSWSTKNGASSGYVILKNLPFKVNSGTGSFVDIIVNGGTTDRFSIYPIGTSNTCQFRKNGHSSYALVSDFLDSGRFSCIFTYIATT
ncbi:hypothetical protein [Peribacillus frigoritolerans]|uniref:hypothetical protein n=1 Tax=Peribacillus frigoritolerans TaxID=450367 RepID=UPI003017537C